MLLNYQMRFISVKDSMQIMRIKGCYTKVSGDKIEPFDPPENERELKKIYLKLAMMMHPDNKSSGMGSK